MTAGLTRISANISVETKERMEQYVRAAGSNGPFGRSERGMIVPIGNRYGFNRKRPFLPATENPEIADEYGVNLQGRSPFIKRRADRAGKLIVAGCNRVFRFS